MEYRSYKTLQMHSPIEQHYHQENLYEAIIAAFQNTGIEPKDITRQLLSAADEFHVRGREVTAELAQKTTLQPGMRVLDVGCGIGGPARFLAGEFGCHVTGIDLTPEYTRTAGLLSRLTSQEEQTNFIVADALQLPFEKESFDRVWTQHVQMNIADKKKFYQEIHRVLKPGGQFIYYDIFSANDEPIHFPVPWAGHSSLSHLITTADLKQLLNDTGFSFIERVDQTVAGIQFLEKLRARIQQQGLPEVSLKLVVNENFEEKFSNLYENFIEGKICLESGICQK